MLYIVILATGFRRADAIASLIVVALMLRAAWGLLRDSGHCFTSGHCPQILDQLQTCLAGHFDVEHSTFQLEPAGHTAHEAGAHP